MMMADAEGANKRFKLRLGQLQELFSLFVRCHLIVHSRYILIARYSRVFKSLTKVNYLSALAISTGDFAKGRY